MPLILAAVTTWEEAMEEPLEVFTDQAADAVDADVVLDQAAVEQMTGALAVPCVPTAKADSVPRSLAPDATLAAAQVSLSHVLLVPLSTTLAVNAARRRLHLESASGHACGHAAAPALHPSLSSNL